MLMCHESCIHKCCYVTSHVVCRQIMHNNNIHVHAHAYIHVLSELVDVYIACINMYEMMYT